MSLFSRNRQTAEMRTEASRKALLDDMENGTAGHEQAPKPRNRAVMLFVILVVAGGLAILAYFVTGRGWSVAAAIVDENIGRMDDYTVVVFSGTADRDGLDERERATIYHGEGAGETNLSEGLIPYSEDGAVSYSNLGDRIMSVFYRAMAKFRTEGQAGLYASDVRNLYEDSGADVFTLSLDDYARYSVPRIYALGNKRIGVFSVSSYISRSRLAATIDSMDDEDADIVICMAKDPGLIPVPDGIDVVIAEGKVDDSDEHRLDGSYLIPAPYEDEVGIILLSANNVPVYKSITEL